jgi:hypothetical protein
VASQVLQFQHWLVQRLLLALRRVLTALHSVLVPLARPFASPVRHLLLVRALRLFPLPPFRPQPGRHSSPGRPALQPLLQQRPMPVLRLAGLAPRWRVPAPARRNRTDLPASAGLNLTMACSSSAQ